MSVRRLAPPEVQPKEFSFSKENFCLLYTSNRIFKQRTVDVGVVKLADAWNRGFSGVMVRGSGAAWDLRKAQPYELSLIHI